jgi:hypothetical protein
MSEVLLDGPLLLLAAVVVLFPIFVFFGVRLLRIIVLRRNPDIEP